MFYFCAWVMLWGCVACEIFLSPVCGVSLLFLLWFVFVAPSQCRMQGCLGTLVPSLLRGGCWLIVNTDTETRARAACYRLQDACVLSGTYIHIRVCEYIQYIHKHTKPILRPSNYNNTILKYLQLTTSTSVSLLNDNINYTKSLFIHSNIV